MKRRIPQPPVDPLTRSAERHHFWPGALLGGVGLVLILGGVLRSTVLPTVQGGVASEVELMQAFAQGGLERVRPAPPPDPVAMPDPVAFRLAMDRWQRERGQVVGLGFQVNTAAKDPCPT